MLTIRTFSLRTALLLALLAAVTLAALLACSSVSGSKGPASFTDAAQVAAGKPVSGTPKRR